MISNYFKVTLRNIIKNKLHSCINILGLGIAIACCTLISFLLKHELSYDKFYNNATLIYRVLPDLPNINVTSLPCPLIPDLAKTYPEIKQAVRLFTENGHVKINENSYEEKISYTDTDFFEIFDFPLAKGKPNQILSDRFSAVLSQRAAYKYFGDESPIGKVITINHSTHIQSYIIRGVTKPIPSNSSIQFSILLPFENLKYGQHATAYENWGQYLVSGFICLSKNNQINTLTEKLTSFVSQYMKIDFTSNSYFTPQKGLKFQPFREYHLGEENSGPGLEPVTNRKYLYVLIIIATLILLMACFNFINLTVGCSSRRFKEVGMRKVLGAQRSQLVRQFWFESALISCIAFFIGLAMANLFLPSFNTLLNTNLSKDYIGFFFLGGVILLIGILAGSYPALLMSGFKTVDIFKGKLKIGGTNPITRLMIMFQFVIAICLIISVLLFTKQLGFIQKHDLGFNPRNIIVIPTQVNQTTKSEGVKLLEHYKFSLANNPDIINISASSGSFQRWFPMISFFKMKNGTTGHFARYGIDANFIQTMELKLIEGRNFIDGDSDINNSMIVNENFMHTFADIAKLNNEFPYQVYMFKKRKIIGVVKDFHFQSLRKTIMPAALLLDPKGETRRSKIECILIKVKSENIDETIDTLRNIWEKYRTNHAFLYNFMEDDILHQYQTEQRWQRIITFATTFAIIIASLGVFGLASISVSRREKEIGIRKVLGASVVQILNILNREYILLFLIANIIALPISYFIVNNFLKNFAYRISLNLNDFFLGSFMLLIIIGAVTCSKTLIAALSNPTETLQHE